MQGPAGADGHSPVISLVGDQLVIDGVTQATHLTGPQGPAGAKGADGSNGTNGSDGAAGAKGDTGAQGPAGDPSTFKPFAVAMAVALG